MAEKLLSGIEQNGVYLIVIINNKEGKAFFIYSEYVQEIDGLEVRQSSILNFKKISEYIISFISSIPASNLVLSEKLKLHGGLNLDIIDTPLKLKDFLSYKGSGQSGLVESNLANKLIPHLLQARIVTKCSYNQNLYIDIEAKERERIIYISSRSLEGAFPRNVYAFIEDESECIKDGKDTITRTEDITLSKFRIGQEKFKYRLLLKYKKCKICSLNLKPSLIASHIKPWRDCNDIERMDFYNGFLLCPNHDFLFDKGYISFHDNGETILSETITKSCSDWGIATGIKINLYEENKSYLQWHRERVFKNSRA